METHDQNNTMKRELAINWMRVYPTISAFIRSRIHSFHDAEDVIQEVAVGFADGFDRNFNKESSIPWCLGIARHKVADYYQAKGVEPQLLNEEALQHLAAAFVDIQDEMEVIRKALDDCMSKLHERPQRMVHMRYLQDMSIDKISERFGISANAVYVMLHRIRESLSKCIQHKTHATWRIP